MRLVTFILILLSSFVSAQTLPQQIRVKWLTTNDGLLQNTVRSVLKDKDGFLWISTSDGLQKYDGVRFYKIKPSETDPTALLSDRQCYLFKDGHDNIWISHNRGLSCFIRDKGQFKNVFVFREPLSENLLEGLQKIGEDQQKNIWLFTAKSGFYYLDTKQLKIRATGNRFMNLTFDLSKTIFSELQPDGTCLMNANGNLLHVDLKKQQLIREYKNFIPPVTNLFRLNDTYLCVLQSPLATPYLLSENGKTKTELKLKPSFGLLLAAQLPSSQFLFSFYDQLFYVNPLTNEVSKPITDESGKPLIRNGHVNSLYVDDQGICWVGTNAQGLMYFSSASLPFQLIRNNVPELNFIRGLYYDSNTGNLWAGTFENGIVVYRLNGEFVKQITPATLTSGRETKKGFNAFLPFDDTHLMAWGEYMAPVLINRKTFVLDGVVSFVIPDSLKQLYSHYNGRFYFDRLLQVADGSYWCQYNKSILQFVKKGKSLLLQKIIPCNRNFNEALCLEEASTLWWGNHDVVYTCPVNSNKPVTFISAKGLVKSILPSGDSVWVGTDKGLFLYTKNAQLLKQWTTENGLPNDFIYSLMKDTAGRLWCSSNNGIFLLEPTSGNITTFTEDDGLQGKEFNTNSYLQTTDGMFVWGGVNGINISHPTRFQVKDKVMKPVISSVSCKDSLLIDPVRYRPTDEIVLPHSLSDITITFSNLSTVHTEYSYRIAGKQNEWLSLGSSHSLLLYLTPSAYTVEIKAGKPLEEAPVTQLKITILKPWYATPAAIVFYFLIIAATVVAVVYSIARRRMQKLRQQMESMQKIQAERERISRDLHDHVGSQVTYMLMNLEHIDSNQNQSLQNVKEVSRSIMDSLRETIWALNEKEVTATEFSDKLKTYCRKYVPVPAVFEEHIQNNSPLPKEKVLHVFRLCQEALNNAMKHSDATQITVTVRSDEKIVLAVSIHDNGCGFDTTETKDRNQYGLQNMKQRAAEAGAEIEVSSVVGFGTTVSVQMKQMK